MFKSFLGGIHPQDGKKLAMDKPIETMPVPRELVVPMGQHIGAPCNPTVKVGDMVNPVNAIPSKWSSGSSKHLSRGLKWPLMPTWNR